MKNEFSHIQLKKAALATRFIFFVCGLVLSSWAPMIPYLKSRLGMNDADLGVILLEFGIGAFLVMPITGWLAHRRGSRAISRLASGLSMVILPLLATAKSGVFLGVVLFVFGLLLGATNVSINAQAVAVETRVGRPLMSGFHCLFSVGGLVGASCMSIMLESGLSLETCSYMIAVVIGIIVLSQWNHLLPAEADIKKTATSSFSWPGSKVLFLGMLCFIMFLAEGAMLDWGAVFLRSNGHYDEKIAGIGYAMFSVAMAIGRWTGGSLTQRFGPVNMIRFGGLIAACGLLIALNIEWSYVELVGFFLVGIGASNVVPLLFSAAGRIPETSASFALTVVTTFGYTGILLGPALIGFFAEATSLWFSLGCVSILLAFVGVSARGISFEADRDVAGLKTAPMDV